VTRPLSHLISTQTTTTTTQQKRHSNNAIKTAFIYVDIFQYAIIYTHNIYDDRDTNARLNETIL